MLDRKGPDMRQEKWKNELLFKGFKNTFELSLVHGSDAIGGCGSEAPPWFDREISYCLFSSSELLKYFELLFTAK